MKAHHRQRGTAPALFGGLLSLLALIPSAHAAYPERLITAIVPFTAGGVADILSRIYGGYLGQKLGQTVVIENKAGASGNIGVQAVKDAKPDGYTILMNSNSMTWNPALFQHLPYDPFKDVVPVALVGLSQSAVVVNAKKFPTENLMQFVDYMKKNPGKVNFATAGSGLIENYFHFLNGVDLESIQYQGAGDSMAAVASGEADADLASSITAISSASTGKTRVLAVTGDQRMPALPDVPTTKEAGMPDFQYSGIFGVYVAPGTSREIIDKLNGSLNEISAMPEVVAKLAQLGWIPIKETPEAFADFYRTDIARWQDVAKKANMKPVD